MNDFEMRRHIEINLCWFPKWHWCWTPKLHKTGFEWMFMEIRWGFCQFANDLSEVIGGNNES